MYHGPNPSSSQSHRQQLLLRDRPLPLPPSTTHSSHGPDPASPTPSPVRHLVSRLVQLEGAKGGSHHGSDDGTGLSEGYVRTLVTDTLTKAPELNP